MIKLVRGDINNLEGKLIAFSKFENKEHSGIVAMYSTTNLFEFAEKLGVPKETAEAMEKDVKSKLEPLEQIGIPIRTMAIFASLLPIEDEKDLSLGNEDLLDAGNFIYPHACMDAVQKASEIYYLKFQEKYLEKSDLGDLKESTVLAERNYKDIEKENLKKYLKENFIIPMLDSYNSGGKERDRRYIRARLTEFSKGALFTTPLLGLMEIIDTNQGKPNKDLVDFYLEEISAINAEDYKQAAVFRDKIRAITN